MNIQKRSNVNTLYGIMKHIGWQIRKFFHLFPFTQQISQSRIIADDRYCGVSALINSSDMYDFNNMSLLKLLMEKIENPIFFDIGANIGSYTLIASEESQATVYSFEPHPVTFNRLLKNIKLNQRQNVLPMNIALDKESGKVEFANTAELATNHIIREEKNNMEESYITVESMRAEEFCKLYSTIPHIMKIDVEGFEHDVLSGFGAILSEISIIFLEINGLSAERNGSENSILELLIKYGFIGPMSFDVDKSEFLQYQYGSLEDPIFVNKKLLDTKNFQDSSFKLNMLNF